MERFKINLSTITKKDVIDINNFIKSHNNMELTIRLNNTVGIKSGLLLNIIDYPNLKFRVAGGYDEEREIRTNNKEYYEGKNYYSRNELINVVTIFELIERELIEKDYNDVEKVYYIYNKLKRYIKYDIDSLFEGKSTTLLGLLTRKATSYGFSTIFKEIMDRLGIRSLFVEGNNRSYAWNIILVENKVICLDLGYDSYLYHYGGVLKSRFFGNYNVYLFNREHLPLRSEVIQNYNQNISVFDSAELITLDRKINNNKLQIKANRFVREDKTSFLLSGIEILKMNNKTLYKYLYCNYLKGGRILNPRIIISENNFFINEKRKAELSSKIKNIEGITNKNNSYKQNESSLKHEYNQLKRQDDYLINKFLNEDRIEAINENSYIGSFSYNGHEFSTNFDASLAKINSDVRKYRRDDGSIFIVEKYYEKDKAYYYHLYEFEQSDEDYLLIESNNIIIDNDIMKFDKKNDKYISNIFFHKNRISRAISEYNGYLGYCNIDDKIISREVINNKVDD